MDREDRIKVLESCELFKGIEATDIEKIAALCQAKTCEAGEYVFHQGDFGGELYFIAQGRIILERSVSMDARQGSIVIGIFGKKKVIGCWSGLLAEPHNLMSSAHCEQPTKLLILKASELRGMMVGNREFGFKILENLCFLLRNRIKEAYGALEKI